uniref:WDFY4_0 protein n=1 Tax=Fopius arisanus TaxID=64838 RepID=A0A0C9QDY9_9HYME
MSWDAHLNSGGPADEGRQNENPETKISEEKPKIKRYRNKHMKLFPELYRSDVSINPSYTGLKTLPYYVVCRRRVQKTRKQITRQLNWEIKHMAMMQTYALGGVRIDRTFSIGFPQDALLIPDFATDKERRRINELVGTR